MNRKIKYQSKQYSHSRLINTIPYIERLLAMPIADYRKYAISLILGPYFVNIQHISDSEAFFKNKTVANSV